MCSCLKCTEAYRNYVKDLTVYSELLSKGTVDKSKIYDIHQYIFVSLGVLDGTVDENALQHAHFDLLKDIKDLKEGKAVIVNEDKEVKEAKLKQLADELGVKLLG